MIFADWVSGLSIFPDFFKKITQIGIRKTLNLSKGIAIKRCNENMEFLVLRWSIQSHTFTVAWGKFCPTIEDVVVLMGLPVFREARAIKLAEIVAKVTLDEACNRKLESQNKPLLDSKSSNKSMYASWAFHLWRGGRR